MNGFLVLLILDSESVPVRLCADREEAFRVANKLRGVPPEVLEIWPWDDYHTHYNTKVCRFENGQLVEVEEAEWEDGADGFVIRPSNNRFAEAQYVAAD